MDLVSSFYNKKHDELCLPTVPVNFRNHQEYMEAWMPLFLYETYNQIISSRGASSMDRELSELLGTRQLRNDDDKNFMCQIKKTHCDCNYVYLRIYEDKNICGTLDKYGNYIWP